jgi:hypothetical protein
VFGVKRRSNHTSKKGRLMTHRNAPLTPEGRWRLCERVDAGCDALVFTGAQGGPLRRSRFRARHWVPATRTAGLAGLRFHDYADLRVMPTSARKSLPVAVMAASRSA